MVWVLASGHLLAKVIRFTFVGVLSGLIYALATAGGVGVLGFSPISASVLGYCVSVPMSFLGHRQFSFRANGHWIKEFSRFIVNQAINISIISLSMYIFVNYLHYSYYFGILFTVIFTPISNFILMNFWVFGNSERTGL